MRSMIIRNQTASGRKHDICGFDYYNYNKLNAEASRGAGTQKWHCKRVRDSGTVNLKVVDSISTQGNKIFTIFISSLWQRDTQHAMFLDFS